MRGKYAGTSNRAPRLKALGALGGKGLAANAKRVLTDDDDLPIRTESKGSDKKKRSLRKSKGSDAGAAEP